MNAKTKSITEEQIKSFIQQATFAPSSHNTQPWRFRLNDESVFLFADKTRALPVNDPHNRELTISCGCALMNLRVAAAQAGFDCTIDTYPDATNNDLLAALTFKHAESSTLPLSSLAPAIAKRRTYRKNFTPRSVPPAVLKSLIDALPKEDVWLEVIETEESRYAIAELVSEGDATQWSNKAWRRELADWMHSQRHGDGLSVPAFTAPITKLVVRTFDMGKHTSKKDKQLAEQSPVLAVLATISDGRRDWLSAGQALQRLLLSAQINGLQASYLNQPLQVASLRPKLQRFLTKQGAAQIILRLGFPQDDVKATPRRPLDEVID